MRFTIVTPTYNQADTIKKLYESILTQKDLIEDWILVDDGSDDGKTWEYIKELASKHDWIEGITQTKRGFRLARSLNNARHRVKGDVIFCILGDSYLLQDTMKNLHSNYIEGSAGTGNRLFVDEDEALIVYDYRASDGNTELIQVNDRPYFWSTMCGNGAIIPVEALDKIGWWDEDYEGYGCEDWDVFLRLGASGVPLYQYNMVRFCHVDDGSKTYDTKANVDRISRKMLENYTEETIQSWFNTPGYNFEFPDYLSKEKNEKS